MTMCVMFVVMNTRGALLRGGADRGGLLHEGEGLGVRRDGDLAGLTHIYIYIYI